MKGLVLTGDLMLGRYMVPVIREQGLKNYLLPLKDIFEDRGIVANLECVLADDIPVDSAIKHPLVAPEAFVGHLKELGVVAVSLANNHSYDCKEGGFINTCGVLNLLDIDWFAPYYYSFIEVKDKKFGFVSFSYKSNQRLYDDEYIKLEIKTLRDYCDYLIVFLHTGIELYPYPMPRDEKQAKLMIDCGADLVVGSHSHCLQAAEVYKGKRIYYGIGDLVFDSWKEEVRNLWKTKEAHPKKFGFEVGRDWLTMFIIFAVDDNGEITFNEYLYNKNSGGYIQAIDSVYFNRLCRDYQFNEYVEKERYEIEGKLLKELECT